MLIRLLYRKGMRMLTRGIGILWWPWFRLAGWWLRPRPLPLSFPSQQKILVLIPHPDDEVVGCAGTLLCHQQAGDTVAFLFVTDGGRAASTLTSEQLLAQRQAEAFAAANALAVSELIWLDFPEGAWQVAELVEVLRPLLTSFAPDVIYTPSRVDFHPAHHLVAHALAQALDGATEPRPALRLYPVQVPLTPALANRVVEVTELRPRIQHLLSLYASQEYQMGRAIRQREYAARLVGMGTLVEEFWELTPDAFAALHNQSPATWPSFRSLRFLSLSDPWAYFMGQSERKRLAQESGA